MTGSEIAKQTLFAKEKTIDQCGFGEIKNLIPNTRRRVALENRVLMGDETPITVVQFRGEGPSKNQIWAVLAGPGENRPGVLYLARPDRSSAVLLEALGVKFPDGPDGRPEFKSRVEYCWELHF